jgi:mannose-6-phosphate isomerase-like protein (cupin superfamily)
MTKKIIRSDGLNEFFTGEKCFITEMLNAENFSSFSIARARVASGVTTTLHRLLETDEVYYILSGNGEMEIDGEKMGTVTAHDMVFIPKNATQRITNTGVNDVVFLCICAPRFEVHNYE